MGLDCGGSSTRVRIVDESDQTVFEGSSGPANLASTPPEELKTHLREATQDAPQADVCAGCFAGLLTPADRLRAVGILQETVPAKTYQAFPDYHAALASDLAAHTVLISGTGCIIASLAQGKLVKSSGGGPLIGDEGSVFDLGRLALRATILQGKGDGLTDVLRQSLVDQFGAEDRDHVLAALYKSPAPAARVAKLAPAVVLDYHRGSSYARQSVYRLMASLVEQLRSHHAAYGPFGDSWNVRLTGGLWNIEPEFAGLLTEQFANAAPETEPTNFQILDKAPVEGAVNLAKNHAL